MIVLRHTPSGRDNPLSHPICKSRIINAGDGPYEHPDPGAARCAFTIRQHTKTLEGIKVAIVGDLLHSRVLWVEHRAADRLARTLVSGPPTLVLSKGTSKPGVTVARTVDDAVRDGCGDDAAHPAGAHAGRLLRRCVNTSTCSA